MIDAPWPLSARLFALLLLSAACGSKLHRNDLAPDAGVAAVSSSDGLVLPRGDGGGSESGYDPDQLRPDAAAPGAMRPPQVVGPPARLAFAVQPRNGRRALPLAPFRVVVEDAAGTIVPVAAEISVVLGGGTAGAALLGKSNLTATAGQAIFDVMGINEVGKGYTLTAMAPGLAAAMSVPFDITPPPFQLVDTGAYGGEIFALATARGAVYAGTSGGLYKSTDNGASWAPFNFGLDAGVATIAVDATGTNLYVSPCRDLACTGGSQGFKMSKNGGAWWSRVNAPFGQAQAIALDPTNAATFVVAGLGGVFKSTDGGANLVKTSFPGSATAVAVDPTNPNTVYAIGNGHLYKSVDAAATWGPGNSGLDPGVRASWVVATPRALFAGLDVALHRSVDGGATWTALPLRTVRTVAHAPANPQRIYAAQGASGVAASNDGGATFAPSVSVGGGVVETLAVDVQEPNRVYAGTRGGVYLSNDGGATWALSSKGILTAPVTSAAMLPGAPSLVLIGARNGVYRSTNGGGTWSSQGLGEVEAVRIDPANPNRAFACTLAANMHASADGGATFGPPVATGGGPYCYNIDVRGAVLYVPTVRGGVRKSIDGGASWSLTGVAFPSYSVVTDATGLIVLAGTNGGLFRSANGGTDWAKTTNDSVRALAVDLGNPAIAYAGHGCETGANGAVGNGGISKSADAGITWASIAKGICVDDLVVIGTTLYAAGRSGSGGVALLVSKDSGATWVPTQEGVPSHVEGLAVAASADGNTIYLGTSAGLWRSTTGGL